MKKINLLIIFLLANIGFNLLACQNAAVLRTANDLLNFGEEQYQKMLTLLKENINREFLKEYFSQDKEAKASIKDDLIRINPNIVVDLSLVLYRALSGMGHEFENFINNTFNKAWTITGHCPALTKKYIDFIEEFSKKGLDFEKCFDATYCRGNTVINELNGEQRYIKSQLGWGSFNRQEYTVLDKSICPTCKVEAFCFTKDDFIETENRFYHAPYCADKTENKSPFYYIKGLSIIHKIIYGIQFNQLLPIWTQRNIQKNISVIKNAYNSVKIHMPTDLIKLVAEYYDPDNLEKEVRLLKDFVLITKERLTYYRIASLIVKESRCSNKDCHECIKERPLTI